MFEDCIRTIRERVTSEFIQNGVVPLILVALHGDKSGFTVLTGVSACSSEQIMAVLDVLHSVQPVVATMPVMLVDDDIVMSIGLTDKPDEYTTWKASVTREPRSVGEWVKIEEPVNVPAGVPPFLRDEKPVQCRHCGLRIWHMELADKGTFLWHERPQCEAFLEKMRAYAQPICVKKEGIEA